MTDEIRHPYMIEPNEGVLLTDSLIVYRDRVRQFLFDTGITPEDVVLAPVVSIPLPITSATAGIRNRPQAAPEMMWFPLFWLPLDVGLRYRVRDTEDGSLRVETSEEWAVRVMTMSAVAGLFDPETGTWLDALATVGIDAFDPDTHRRVAEWQRGGSDPDLDRIDLTSRFTATDEEIAEMILSAQQFTQVQWAISAGEIRLATAGILAMELADEDLAGTADSWAFLALAGFSGNPELPSGASVQSVLSALIGELQTGATTPSQAIHRISRISNAVYRAYGHQLDEAGALAAA